MRILVCGGDTRSLFAAKKLREDGADICDTMTGDAAADDLNAAAEKAARCDAVLLPLPVLRAGIFNAPSSPLRLTVGELTGLLRGVRLIVGGILPPALLQAPELRGSVFYDHYRDPVFTAENAALTAEGVLGMLIAETPRAVNGAEYLITGFGTCGSAVARSLCSAGAHITVAARREKARRSAELDGCRAVSFEELPAAAPRFDAVVNTVPAQVVGADTIGRLKKDALLLEIASAPFGIDFEAAAAYGIRVIKAPGLPGKTAADSAGQIVARCMENYIAQRGDTIWN